MMPADTDDFSGPAGTHLNARPGWTAIGAADGLLTADGRLRPSGADGVIVRTDALPTGSQVVSADVYPATTDNVGNTGVGLVARYSAVADTGYLAYEYGGKAVIAKRIDGVQSTLADADLLVSAGVGFRFRFRTRNGAQQLDQSEDGGATWTTLVSAADSGAGLPAAGCCGVLMVGVAGGDGYGLQIDNYRAAQTVVVPCVGDSLTEGAYGQTPWPTQAVALLPAEYYLSNLGHGGYTVAQLAALYAGEVAPLYDAGAANVLFLFAGSNDLPAGHTGSQIAAALDAYLTAALADAAWLPILGTILPRGDVPDADPARLVANALIRANAQAAGVCVWTADPAFDDISDTSNPTNFIIDPIHLTTVGHGVLASYAAPRILAVVNPYTTTLSLSGPTGPLADGDADAAGNVAHNALRTYTVANNGDAEAPNVAVAVPANTTLVGGQPGTIPPGESRMFRMRFTTPGAVDGDLVITFDGGSYTVGVTATVGEASAGGHRGRGRALEFLGL